MLLHVTIDPLWLWILLSHHVISCYCNVAITPQMVCLHELTQMNGTTHIDNITTLLSCLIVHHSNWLNIYSIFHMILIWSAVCMYRHVFIWCVSDLFYFLIYTCDKHMIRYNLWIYHVWCVSCLTNINVNHDKYRAWCMSL